MTIPTAYLGPQSYFDELVARSAVDEVRIEVMESFEKQTFRNRCWIQDLQGRLIQLTVPVKKVEHKQLTRDIEISYQSRWQHQHLIALRSAYEHTPYFLYYADLLRPWYEKTTRWLIDLNEQLTQVILAIMQRRIEPDGRIHNTLNLQRTSDWEGLTWTDRHPWQHELSILDRLMREGE